MSRAVAIDRARDLREHLHAAGVERVSIELVEGRGSAGWSDDNFVATMGHHIVSYRAQGPTSHLAMIKQGRSDLPGPLANGYGGWDLTARIICMGWANHAGRGGPVTVPAGTIPQNGGRPYFFGWEFEGGINEHEWTDDYREFMARCLAGTLSWLGRDEDSHHEHKTWAPGRKSDRLGYTLNRARREIREELEVIRRDSKADDGIDSLAGNHQKMVEAGVFSEYTQPGGVTFNDELATFLVRAGLRPEKGARTWTKKEIRNIAVAAAGGGAGSALVIQQIIDALQGIT